MTRVPASITGKMWKTEQTPAEFRDCGRERKSGRRAKRSKGVGMFQTVKEKILK